MKKSKKNYVLIALVVILLCIAVGYAAFSANLTINGTANASGTWDVKFVSATINEAGHGNNPTISTDGKTLTVEVNLAYPGDGCTITANIKNNGTIPAILTGYEVLDANDQTFANNDIAVICPEDGDGLETTGNEIINAGETCPYTFAVQWKDSSTATQATAKFKISFTYAQPNAATVNPIHGAHTK